MNNEIFKTLTDEIFSDLDIKNSSSFCPQFEVEDNRATFFADDFIIETEKNKYSFYIDLSITAHYEENRDENWAEYSHVSIDVHSAELWIDNDELKVMSLANRIYLESALYKQMQW